MNPDFTSEPVWWNHFLAMDLLWGRDRIHLAATCKLLHELYRNQGRYIVLFRAYKGTRSLCMECPELIVRTDCDEAARFWMEQDDANCNALIRRKLDTSSLKHHYYDVNIAPDPAGPHRWHKWTNPNKYVRCLLCNSVFFQTDKNWTCLKCVE